MSWWFSVQKKTCRTSGLKSDIGQILIGLYYRDPLNTRQGFIVITGFNNGPFHFLSVHPLRMVSDFRPDFFFHFALWIFDKELEYHPNPPAFCDCKGYGWPWISGKICNIIHNFVGFEQFIFCSCLDFFFEVWFIPVEDIGLQAGFFDDNVIHR